MPIFSICNRLWNAAREVAYTSETRGGFFLNLKVVYFRFRLKFLCPQFPRFNIPAETAILGSADTDIKTSCHTEGVFIPPCPSCRQVLTFVAVKQTTEE